jgi:hypothetical protein
MDVCQPFETITSFLADNRARRSYCLADRWNSKRGNRHERRRGISEVLDLYGSWKTLEIPTQLGIGMGRPAISDAGGEILAGGKSTMHIYGFSKEVTISSL